MFSNEYPIASAFIDQLEEFFDVSHLISHNSVDKTETLVSRRGLQFSRSNLPGYPQSALMTELLHKAFKSGADLVVPLDFDEFLPFENRKTFENYLKECGEIDVLEFKWRNIFPRNLGDPDMFSKKFCFGHEKSSFGKAFVFKRAFEKNTDIKLSQGNHSLISQNIVTRISTHQLLHLPIHSGEHFAQKIIVGAAVIKEGNLGNEGVHWTNYSRKPIYSESELQLLAFDYGEAICESHEIEQSDFLFPYVKSTYFDAAKSALDSILGNWEKIVKSFKLAE
jgi:hypothetical protein